MLHDNPRVDLIACGCECYSASRMPKPEVLENHYCRYYDKDRGDRHLRRSERFGAHLYGMLQSAQRSAMRILDFGGGSDAALSRSVAREFIGSGTQRVAIASGLLSIVQEDFKAFIRAALAHVMKSPWYLFRSRNTMVGGWEAVIVRAA